MPRLKKLDTNHWAAIRMRIEGKPNVDIASELNVRERTLHVWFSDPLVKAAIQEQLARVNEIFAERMAGTSLSGLAALNELLALPVSVGAGLSPSEKLHIIEAALDRDRRTARVVEMAAAIGGGDGPGAGNTLNVMVGNMTDQQLLDKAHELLGMTAGSENGHGSIDSTATDIK